MFVMNNLTNSGFCRRL